jgi:hypothetical protein
MCVFCVRGERVVCAVYIVSVLYAVCVVRAVERALYASWRSHLFPCFARVFAWYLNYARRPALIFRSSWASASSDKESYTLKNLRAVPR